MNDFDHRPDRALGEALREALSSADDAAFARRVLEHMPATLTGESWWGVLGDWARPGVAAAAAVLVAVSVSLPGQPGTEAPQPDMSATAAETTLSAGTLLASRALPEFQVEMVLGDERVDE
jgi:hypothetical protein